MNRCIAIFLLSMVVVIVSSTRDRLPLFEEAEDVITDDEDDILNDMPQNGPDDDNGSGLEDIDADRETTSRISTYRPRIGQSTSSPVTTKKLEQVITLMTTTTVNPQAPADEGAISKAALTGIIIAVIVAVILIVIIVIFLVKRSKRNGGGRREQRRGRQPVPQQC